MQQVVCTGSFSNFKVIVFVFLFLRHQFPVWLKARKFEWFFPRSIWLVGLCPIGFGSRIGFMTFYGIQVSSLCLWKICQSRVCHAKDVNSMQFGSCTAARSIGNSLTTCCWKVWLSVAIVFWCCFIVFLSSNSLAFVFFTCGNVVVVADKCTAYQTKYSMFYCAVMYGHFGLKYSM